MRLSLTIWLALLLAAPALAQRHKLDINAETPEGKLLQQIGQEEDAAKKAALLEEFAGKYPKHEAAVWVYSQMPPLYIKANQFDKALGACEKLLALDPEDAQSAHTCLKAAEAKKDPDSILAWSERASQVARKVAASPKPKEEGEEENWKASVDFAKQLDTYTEYSLYAAALATPDVGKKAMLLEALEKRNPQYQYIPALRQQVFLGLIQAKQIDQAVAMAEKQAEKNQANEDMLLLAADHYLNHKDPEKTVSYSEKLVAYFEGKPKPEGMSDADWETKKQNAVGRAHWMIGVTYATQNKFAQADKSLRQALPLIGGNEQLKAGALFYLGLANFKLGDTKVPDKDRIIDALRFSQQCAAIKSPFQARAAQNVKAITTQYRIK